MLDSTHTLLSEHSRAAGSRAPPPARVLLVREWPAGAEVHPLPLPWLAAWRRRLHQPQLQPARPGGQGGKQVGKGSIIMLWTVGS